MAAVFVLILIPSVPTPAESSSKPLLQTRAASAAAERDALARARRLYNDERFDEAIQAATEAKRLGSVADAAALVLARSHLERYRLSADPVDLSAAREALRDIRPEVLGARDRSELVVGLGESLYLDDAFGAAAEIFAGALARPEQMTVQARERVLDWWASAIDRQAQSRPAADRASLYRRILERMEDELRQDPLSAPGSYWIAAAARGLGDLDRAWEAAVAGWVLAPLASDRGAALRADLDRLVQQAIIPDRVRLLSMPNRDPDQAAAGMRAEWDLVKQKWSGRSNPSLPSSSRQSPHRP